MISQPRDLTPCRQRYLSCCRRFECPEFKRVLTASQAGRNIPGMTGRILLSAVGHSVLGGLFLCAPLHAGPSPQSQEPTQGDTERQDVEQLGTVFSEGLVLPQFDPEAVWLRSSPEQEDPAAELRLASSSFNLAELFENFDVHNGPVRNGAPTHTDMIRAATPLEFSAPPAISFDVVGWTWKNRR